MTTPYHKRQRNQIIPITNRGQIDFSRCRHLTLPHKSHPPPPPRTATTNHRPRYLPPIILPPKVITWVVVHEQVVCPHLPTPRSNHNHTPTHLLVFLGCLDLRDTVVV